ncbi:MAG TPA: helix-turn-helix domain-containing protein [Gemmatimonadales bacterium]|nr:helix-turn-helix domain-containing protein [Gemmatimonadales bacterium]
MYDYNEACPISMAASVLCERWTLQIVREMFFGSTRYSEIQRFIPNISPSLLRNRLRFLEQQGLIVRKRVPGASRYEYFLTPAGKALGPVLTEMGKWGMRWSRDGMTDKQNTSWGLVRDFASRIDLDELPSGDTSIRLVLTDAGISGAQYIHVRGGKVQVCDTDLGFEVDVEITSTVPIMTRIWYGELDMATAMRDGQMGVRAAPVYSRRIRRWLGISSFTTDTPAIASA